MIPALHIIPVNITGIGTCRIISASNDLEHN